ncbi:MAG: tetratricopeptide repeat protein [Phycisphaerales bacterium]|jgi:hypothetical protein
MNPEDRLNQLITNSDVATGPETDKRILGDALEHLARLKQKKLATTRPNTWRTIMKNRTTRVAAAAVVLIAVVLSIMFWDKSATPAYAIEQTIEAFRTIRHLHVVSRNEAGKITDERWIEVGPDGLQTRYRQDTHSANFYIVEDGAAVAVYYKDRNTMVLYDPKDKGYLWISHIGSIFENAVQQGIIIDENIGYRGLPAHRIRWLLMNQDCYIDPETKLPIALFGCEISYETPPEDIFEIVVPDNAAVIDKQPGATPTPEPDWLKEKETADQNFGPALQALAQGQYDKAVELLEHVVQNRPLRNQAWFWLGKARFYLGRHDEAIVAFSKALEITGSQPHCHLARGLAYKQAGLNETAKKDFAKALPWMILALRRPESAAFLEYAEDPLLRYRVPKQITNDTLFEFFTREQLVANMIERLRTVSNQNFGYDPNTDFDEKERAISAWESWWSEQARYYGVSID